MADLTFHEKVVDIQQRLKVPKDLDNEFGNFKYRNLEDIEDKLKPLLKEHSLILTFVDDIVEVGGRVYVKATANISDSEKNYIDASAFAREAATPKAKMDDAQLTGSCSSYARKYAISGLLLIDNTKDADSMDNSEKKTKVAPTPAPSQVRDRQLKDLQKILDDAGVEKDKQRTVLDFVLEGRNVRDLEFTEVVKLIEDLKALQPQTLINISNGEPF